MRTAFKKISTVVGWAAVLTTLVSAAPAAESAAPPGTLKLKVSLQAPQAIAGSEPAQTLLRARSTATSRRLFLTQCQGNLVAWPGE